MLAHLLFNNPSSLSMHNRCCWVVLKNTGWWGVGAVAQQAPMPAPRGCGGPAGCPWA